MVCAFVVVPFGKVHLYFFRMRLLSHVLLPRQEYEILLKVEFVSFADHVFEPAADLFLNH